MKKSNWYVFFFTGVIILILGIMAAFTAKETILTFARYLGIILIIIGAIMIYFGYRSFHSPKKE